MGRTAGGAAPEGKEGWTCAFCTMASAACSLCPPIMPRRCALQGIQCFCRQPHPLFLDPSDYNAEPP